MMLISQFASTTCAALSPDHRARFRTQGWLSYACQTLAVGVLGITSSIHNAAAATGGAGAPLPYVEIQAENASTNGTVLPITYTYNTLGGEASGRRAVTLDAVGEFVEFTLPSAANSIVVRYSIPDSPDGAPYNAPLGVFINGQRQPTDLTLTNTYSHYYGAYPFNNNPGSGNHHHFYDEVSTLLPAMQAGDRVRLQMVATAAASITIDLADFEPVGPAAGAPANSITVVADATGQSDATNAINQAIAQAAGRIVWIPAGRYLVNGRIMVNNVSIRGAGMWHTVLNFSGQGENTGFHGTMPPNVSTNVNISDLRMNGNIRERNDGAQTNAFGGGLSSSTITNVWVEHFKVGAWMFGPATNLRFTRVRMRDTNADGINFNGGFTNSHVTQSHFRNNGDDSLAMWSFQSPDVGNSFTFNTVELPILANGIAIYGGSNNSVTDNRLIDTGLSQGGGIHIGNRFQAPPLGGTTTVARNTLIRSGNLDPNWQFGVGAIWFDSRDQAMNGTINVTDLLIQQSPYSAIMFVSGNGAQLPVTNVSFNDVTVQGVGTYVLQVQDPGTATFQNVVASNIGRAGIWNCLGAGRFNIGDNGGNESWISSTLCSGTHPTPIFPPPVGGLIVNPTALDFGSQAVGVSSSPRAVTVTNSAASAAAISSIAASGGNGDFSQTNNCGSSIAANASCTVNVVFMPTVAGTRTGTLAINSNAGNTSVALNGVGTAPGPVISATPSSLTFASTAIGSTSTAQTIQLRNTGTVAATISTILASGDFAQTNTCGGSLAVAASCTISVTFRPTAEGSRTGTVTVNSNANNTPTTIALSGSGIGSNTNVAAGRPASASSSQGGFPPTNGTDGNVDTYWESASNAFPQSFTVDLGATIAVGRVVLKLPVSWPTRQQTLSILGSNDGTNFTTIVPSAQYTFTGGTNVVSIPLNPIAQARHVRVTITANTGWPAGQLSEIEVYPGTVSSGLTVTPSSFAFGSQTIGTTSAVQSVTLRNTGTTAVTISSINASGDFLQTNNCGTALAGNGSCAINVSFRPTAAGNRTGAITINSGAPTITIALSGTGTEVNSPGNNLAIGKTISASSFAQDYVPTRANDANATAPSYWESANNAFPQWIQVDLGAPTTINSIILKLPPTWEARTQTLSVQGSSNSTTFVTIVASSSYPFSPLSSNLVEIEFTATTTRYVRVNFTANTAWPAGQVSELEIYGAQAPGLPTLSANPTSQAFGNQLINTTSAARSVAITNTGSSSVTVSGVTMSGEFQQTNSCAAIAAGASCTVNVTFRPTSAGAKSGTVTVSSNASNPSLTVALTGNGVSNSEPQSDQAPGKPMTSTPPTHTFVAANANDGNLATYWESAVPSWLNIALGANVKVSQVVVRLNPDPSWGTRTQTISIEGRDQAGGVYVTLVGSAQYTFNPAGNANTVTINVPATAPAVADLRLSFTANTGAPGGQVAELQVFGVPAPNPDLTISGVTASPASPNETTPITVSATVSNTGTAPTPAATNMKVYCGGAQVGPAANVPILQAGASQTVTLNIGTLPVGACAVSARVDDPSTIVEQSEANNSATGPTLTVGPAPGPDLQVVGIASNPPNPAVGAAVTFVVSVNNRGTDSVAAGTTTRVVVGTTTLNNSNSPAIGAGVTVNVAIPGSWAATSGGATLLATADATSVVAETNENNNSLSQGIVVGRGAAVPYVELEAEGANFQGTLLVADATRTFGHTQFGSESSGRQSVRLNGTGEFVEFTSTSPANSIVVRNSIPDAPAGGGIEATISLYATPPGGSMTFVQKIALSSRHSWLYGNTDDTEGLSNSPGPDARRLFDESQALLSTTYPTGTRFRLQRDSNDTATFYIIDLIDLELVAPPLSQPANCTSITTYGATPNDNTDDTAAIQRAVMDDQNGVIQCVWIPPGRWRQEQKILTPDPTRGQFNQLGVRNVVIRGAGMWHSQLFTTTQPQNVVGNINHPHEGNVGFEIEDNVQISDLAIFGMTTNRANRGHGLNGRFGANSRFSNVWIEHVNVGAWVGRDFSDTPAYWNPGNGLEFTGMRIRNTYADGINFSNGTRNSRVFNSHFRNTGDDSLAVWANPFVRDQAADVGRENRFTNNTVQLPWRANGIAIYGGANNSIENNLIYDTMTFPGIMLATDHSPLPFSGTTLIANNGLFRCGGVFFGEAQRYGAITLFPSGQPIVGAVIRDTDIFDSTYDGIQFKTGGGEMPNVAITNVRIDDSNNGGAGILAMGGARGNATLTNVTITNSAAGHVGRNPGSQFVFTGTVNGAPVQPVVVP